MLSHPVTGRSISQKVDATKMPSKQLLPQSLLAGVAVAVASGLLAPAHADWATTKAARQGRQQYGAFCSPFQDRHSCVAAAIFKASYRILPSKWQGSRSFQNILDTATRTSDTDALAGLPT